MTSTIRPSSFAHVVYRTRRYEGMLAWYQRVFGAIIQHQTPLVAFLAYDEEHHRIAIVNMDMVQPNVQSQVVSREKLGVDHVAYGFQSLRTLCEKYSELKEQGIRPFWCIHHGVTISMYYGDPDGNRMEFQVDCFETVKEANDFLNGSKFKLNPIGVEFDPDAMLARLRVGEDETSFFHRKEDLPVSPIRHPALV